jgi:dTDP-4-dehydrorhamnose 3,5-epimerase
VKVVKAIKGALWDVIADLRPGSPSYRKWFGAELTEDNRSTLSSRAGSDLDSSR